MVIEMVLNFTFGKDSSGLPKTFRMLEIDSSFFELDYETKTLKLDMAKVLKADAGKSNPGFFRPVTYQDYDNRTFIESYLRPGQMPTYITVKSLKTNKERVFGYGGAEDRGGGGTLKASRREYDYVLAAPDGRIQIIKDEWKKIIVNPYFE